MNIADRHRRSVHIRTTFGAIEGILASSGMLRLLDDINVVAKRFLTVHDPLLISGSWACGDGPIVVSKSSVLYVRELQGCAPPPNNRRVSNHFTRSPVELLMQEHAVHGFVHVPPGGDPMMRLNQGEHAFVALTSASVIGPGDELATPFLAVNRGHILAARPIGEQEPGSRIELDETALAAPLDDPIGL